MQDRKKHDWKFTDKIEGVENYALLKEVDTRVRTSWTVNK